MDLPPSGSVLADAANTQQKQGSLKQYSWENIQKFAMRPMSESTVCGTLMLQKIILS